MYFHPVRADADRLKMEVKMHPKVELFENAVALCTLVSSHKPNTYMVGQFRL